MDLSSIGRRPRIGPAALVLAAGLVAVAGCSPSERDRIARVLVERAPALDGASRREIARAVTAAGRAHDVDPWLLLAVIEVESTYHAHARGRRGAVGLMQVKPETAREVAHRTGYEWRSEADLLRPQHNVSFGAAYLAELKRRFRTWPGALTAYNQGPRRARRLEARNPELTSTYAKRVLRIHAAMLERAAD